MRAIRLHGVMMVLAAFAMTAFTPVEAGATSGKQKASQKATATKSTQKTNQKKKSSSQAKPNKQAAPKPDLFAALVVDSDTGRVLYEKNAAGIRYPASLTKMMTLYLTFHSLKYGKLTLDQNLAVSSKAASQPQTNIALKTGDRIPVRSAIESLVVRSANDAAMVLGEAIGGTEWNFALMMTKKAHELGMKNTVFRNPSGLPDNKQHTTAYDMARLSIALRRDFPEYYAFFKVNNFTWNGVTYTSHNRVMSKYAGVDGIKTGYIRASGFNLATSAKRNGHNLVAVIMGGTTAADRDAKMMAMLDRTFAQLESQKRNYAANTVQEPAPPVRNAQPVRKADTVAVSSHARPLESTF